MQFLEGLIFPGGFMPHGNGYLWTPSLIGLHVVSDSLIVLSYLPIPTTPVQPFRETTPVQPFRETVHTPALYRLLVNQPPPRQAMPYRTEKSA
jgi:hypothetical protein